MDLPYRQFFESMPCYLTVQDKDFRIIEANRRFHEDFGEFDGRYCYQVYKHREDRCEECPVARTFRDGEQHHSEEQVRRLDGKDVSVIVYTAPIRDESGEITAVMEMSTDITDIKSIEGQLRYNQQRHRHIFEEVPCYISIQDRDLRVVRANRRFREDFGDSLGCKCYELYKHRDRECVPCPVQQTFRDGEMHQSEEVVTSQDGRPINVLVSTSPIRNAEGEIERVMEMSTNITQIRELQSQLASIGLMVGQISHGIKGLLSGLDGGRYLLNTGLKKGDQDRVERGWDMVQRNMAKIKSMVLDMLYYAKDREPLWETVSAGEVAGDLFEMVQAKARRRGVEVRRDFDAEAGEFEADPQAVRSLLINLLDNSFDACRSDEGALASGKKAEHHIDFRLRGGADCVEYEIEDNGIGMDQETREKAFTLFFSSKGADGTGLGLFIANKIAQAHGGEIVLYSEIDKGTRFAVKLPRKRPKTVETGENLGAE